jgi:hypothetical protein
LTDILAYHIKVLITAVKKFYSGDPKIEQEDNTGEVEKTDQGSEIKKLI